MCGMRVVVGRMSNLGGSLGIKVKRKRGAKSKDRCESFLRKGILRLPWDSTFTSNLVTMRPPGERHYTVEFQGKVEDCPEFVNTVIDFTKVKVDSEKDASYLSGSMEFKEVLHPGIAMLIKVYKEEGTNRELFNLVEGDICKHIKDKEAPWHPLMEAMNISTCPIRSGNYDVLDFKVDMSDIERFISHELCGDYYIELAFVKAAAGAGPVEVPGDTVSCHSLSVSLKELMDADCRK
ncbi:hypothetical protein EVAR_18759_1 [Eumeta japonica]|uniref:Uncharacterized protein n=1 Tax=Eumeta variegata TaxID=151549 RepID=A0A4C1UNZ9_EUMVA|nr:hypothetical protein EVAR_18759_1 [Eumeta japonica]